MTYDDPSAVLEQHVGESVRIHVGPPFVDAGYGPTYDGTLITGPSGVYLYREDPPLISTALYQRTKLLVAYTPASIATNPPPPRFTRWVGSIEPIPTDEPDFFEE